MRSKFFQNKRDDLYKAIITEQERISLSELCSKLKISQSTYYRILKEYTQPNENTITKKKSKKITEAGMINNIDSTQLCHIDNCPTNTRECFDKDHPLYTHMIMCHVDEIASLTK